MKTVNVGVVPHTRTGEPFADPSGRPLADFGALLALMLYVRIPNDSPSIEAGRRSIRLLDTLERTDRPATVGLEDADYDFLVQRAEAVLPQIFGSVHAVGLVDLLKS